MLHHRTGTALARCLLALILATLGALPVAAQAPSDQPVLQENRRWVQVLATHDEAPRQVPAPDLPRGPQLQTSTVVMHYVPDETQNPLGDQCYAWPPAAKAAADYAASIWSSLISSPVPIVVNACWTDLPSGVLGYGGAYHLYANSSGVQYPNTWYPVALASARAGVDLNALDPEIIVAFGRSFPWYVGTDAQPPTGTYDLVSVLLHEIGHGIGFSGSMAVEDGLGYWGYGSGSIWPAVYDLFAENAAGQSLTSIPNGSAELAAFLTSNAVFFDSPTSLAAAGGRPPLYAPSAWQPRSSYSHLDHDAYHGTAHSLMTPMLSDGAAYHHPGTIALSMLWDIGWQNLMPAPPVDLGLQMSLVSPPAPHPGDTVTYSLTVRNKGTTTASGGVLTNLLPPNLQPVAWDVSGALSGATLRQGAGYVWDLPSLPAGAQGVITVQATIGSALSGGWVVRNVASVLSAGIELSPDDNMDAMVLGGSQLYLPSVIR